MTLFTDWINAANSFVWGPAMLVILGAGLYLQVRLGGMPVRSDLIGMMGTFLDTIVVCSMTGLAIVVSGARQTGETGPALTQVAFQSAMPGIGGELVAIALGVFALTTISDWAYYGELCSRVRTWSLRWHCRRSSCD